MHIDLGLPQSYRDQVTWKLQSIQGLISGLGDLRMRVKVEYCFPELQIPRNNKGPEDWDPRAQCSKLCFDFVEKELELVMPTESLWFKNVPRHPFLWASQLTARYLGLWVLCFPIGNGKNLKLCNILSLPVWSQTCSWKHYDVKEKGMRDMAGAPYILTSL